MKIKTEFETNISSDKFLDAVNIFLAEAKRSDEVGFIPIPLKLLEKIKEDELEEIIRILEWKNLIVRKHEPLKPGKIFISVPSLANLQSYKFELEKPIFDDRRGILKFIGKEARYKRNCRQWKLVKLLYNCPNQIFDYKEIALKVGMIDEHRYKTWNERVDAGIKKKINNLVSEIKTKLQLPEKNENLFFCNNGYMLRR